MARPRLYTTDLEKDAATRARKTRYYARHRDAICKHRRQRYQGKQDKETMGISTPGAKPRPKALSSSPKKPKNSLPTQQSANGDCLRSLSAKILAADQELTRIISGTPAAYAALVYDRFLKTSCDDSDSTLDVIRGAIAEIETLFNPVCQSMDDILQIDGVGNEFRAAEEVARRFRTVLGFLEDLKCESLMGLAELRATHRKASTDSLSYPPPPSSLSMAKRKNVYKVYRANDSDDEDLPQARVITARKNGKRLVESARSPQKRGSLYKATMQKPEVWHPSVDFEAMGDEPSFDGFDLGHEDTADGPTVVAKAAAKRYPTSDAPLREWVGHEDNPGYREEYIQEDIRLEGRGDAQHLIDCPTCAGRADRPDETSPLYRCEECFGGLMECRACCVRGHQRLPLHVIQKWNGNFFEKVSLKDLGLRVQLGHIDMSCVNPRSGHKDFMVIHTNGIHYVAVDFCDCDSRMAARQQLLRCEWFPVTVQYPQTCCTARVLEQYHILTLTGKLSGHDFYKSLECLTDNTEINTPKSRYKEFMRAVRQYRHIKMMKRAGRGNIEAGVLHTSRTDLAIACPACPHPGINLPDDWENVQPSLKFLYMLFLALDANFRLKNRIRSSDAKDPGLHTGLAYFVENKPYKAHVLRHTSQTDISTCSGFKTLAQADSRFSTGLRATGVGLCICARHELVRPGGVGELQKGERYCNMDYVFLSAVVGVVINILLTYDIACQWKINFKERMKQFPPSMQLLDHRQLDVGIPKFHAPAHPEQCQLVHSLNIKPGVGRTDGESIERNWSQINPIAPSTKEMGPGSYHNTLDDHFGHHNHRKYVSLGLSLRNRLLLAVPERDRQQGAHDEFMCALPDLKYKAEWLQMVIGWEEDKSKPNPYCTERLAPTEAEIKFRLQEDERLSIANGATQLHETSASSFLVTGMMLEESQRRICAKANRDASSMTTSQASELQDKRVALDKQIARFRSLQTVYMPGVAIKLSAANADSQEKSLDVENLPLWLPSALPEPLRETGCHAGLTEMEEELRVGQCRDALDRIRYMERAKMHFIRHRNKNVRGQKHYTRALTLIERMNDRVHLAVSKYRTSRSALLSLRGPGDWEKELRELKDEDIRSPNATEFSIEDPDDQVGPDGKVKSKKQRIEIDKRLGEGRRLMSWIWQGGVTDGDDDSLNEILRIEWCKGRARALRWKEEVLLLMEEMRRVRDFLEWKAEWWKAQSQAWSGLDVHIAEGVHAYACRQAAIQCALRAKFTSLWEAPRDSVGSAEDQALDAIADGLHDNEAEIL